MSISDSVFCLLGIQYCQCKQYIVVLTIKWLLLCELQMLNLTAKMLHSSALAVAQCWSTPKGCGFAPWLGHAQGGGCGRAINVSFSKIGEHVLW